MLLWNLFQLSFHFCFILRSSYSQTESTTENCSSPLTRDFRADQFSASSEYDTAHNASSARSGGDGWIAGTRDAFQYLKLDLEDIWEITKLTLLTLQEADNRWYTRTFRVSYSNDGYVWMPYNTRLSDESQGELFKRQGYTTSVDLNPSLKARYVTINPVHFYGYPLLLIELFGCMHSAAPTAHVTIAGNSIDVDTTWIPSQSPIIVHSPIVIRPATTLTIQAGVSVIFTTDEAGIEVWGTLISDGIPGVNILLSSNEPVLSAHSQWRGVKQNTGGNITMFNTIVRQAIIGVQGNGSRIKITQSEIHSCVSGIRLYGGSSHNLTNLDITTGTDDMPLVYVNAHNNEDGLQVIGTYSYPNVYIGFSKFDRNNGNGINVLDWEAVKMYVPTHLMILNTSFSRNSQHGIKCRKQGLTTFLISHSVFDHNSNSGMFYYDIWLLENLTVYINISNSKFFDNGRNGINVLLRCYSYSCKTSKQLNELVFANNVFSNQDYAVKLDYFIGSGTVEAGITIENNTFDSNKHDILLLYKLNGYIQIFIQKNSFQHSRFPLKVTSNTLNNNVSVLGNRFTDCITTNTRDVFIDIHVVSAHLFNNSFKQCSLSSVISLSDGIGHSFAFNSFIDTAVSICYISLGQEYDENEMLYVDNNYWGTSDITGVKSKICDFFLDSTKAVAKINRYFINEAMVNIRDSEDVDNFRIERDKVNNVAYIGGIIDRSIDFSDFGEQQLILNRSLLIRKGVHVEIAEVNVTIKKRRGIKVYGSLTVGKQTDDKSRTTLLKLDGEISSSNKWNGVSISSSDVKIHNTIIYGMNTFLEVNGGYSTIVISNCSTTTEKIEHLINGNILNGNLSLFIKESNLSTKSTLLNVRTVDSDIDFTIIDSSLRSEEHVLYVRESNSYKNFTVANIYISSSSISTSSSWKLNMYLEGCLSHLASTIKESKFAAYGQNYFKYLSINMTAAENIFGDAAVALKFAFCGDFSSNFSKDIRISGNHFNSSLAGSDLLIGKAVTDGQNHTFYIANNTFDGHHVASKGGINCHGSNSISLHTLYVDSNVFTNIENGAIGVDCGLKMVMKNLFMANKKCIIVHGYSSSQPVESLEIIGNEFINNTDPDGIIVLDRDESGIQMLTITGNTLEGNTGTVIALKTHIVILKYNFFDNKEAFYNVKVLPSHYKEQESVNASLNYWGTHNPREISKGIYDFDYDNSLLHVEFRPFLGSKNISDIRNSEFGFVSENGEIGGKVNGNITLQIKESPFVVISNINVEENDTLTIEAGVELRLRQGVGIYVKGKLYIFGKVEHPVKFTSEVIGLPWRGINVNSDLDAVMSHIYVNDTEEGITIRGSAFSFSNVSSTFSRTSGISCILPNTQKKRNTTFYFSDVTLEDNSEHGLRIFGDFYVPQDSISAAAFVIRNCVVARNKEYGMTLSTNARIDVINCVISDNGDSGVSISQSVGGGMIYINNSVITSNTKHAIEGTISTGIVIDSCKVRNHTERFDKWGRRYTRGYIELNRRWPYGKYVKSFILFKNTHFQGNTADWIKISSYRFIRGELETHFENNVFTEGRSTFLSRTDFLRTDCQIRIYFQNNTLERNTLLEETTENALVRLYFNAHTAYHIEIIGNVYQDNIAHSCLVVAPNDDDVSTGEMIISENIFNNNNFSSSVVNVQTHISLEMHRNVFDLPHTYRCAIEVPDFDLNLVVNATHNYWGTSVAKEVIETVCGFEKNMSKSIVLTFPYYNNQKLSSLIWETHNLASDMLGGEITKDTNILQDEKDLTIEVHRSIIIREGAKLYIESGITLLFAPNRGIYVQGSLSVIGRDFDVLLESSTDDSPWYGIVINSTLRNGIDRVQIVGTKLRNTLHGIAVHTANFEIKRSEITKSVTNCLALFGTEEMTTFDFENTTFQLCNEVGINIIAVGGISIINANIHDSGTGIGADTFSGSMEVRSCSVFNCSVGISLSSQSFDDNSTIHITRNKFKRITSTAISIILSEEQLASNNTNRTINVELNTFQNACGIVIQTWNHLETTFRDNDLYNAMCLGEDECLMTVFASGSESFEQNRLLDISSNRFENISAKCTIELKDNDVSTLHNTFVHNTVSNNKASDGVILANGRYFNISDNIFDNPESVFDVVTTLKGKYSINVTHNWWGSPDSGHVFSRIFDQRRMSDLILFSIEPVLLDRLVNCIDVHNCSSHGECINPNHCRCSSGWTGTSCTKYDCSDVINCYGNGICTGPNTCSCDDGWSGKKCIIASCINVNNCSGHGFCVRPNGCTCAARFTGNDCNSCIPLHGGPSCQPCPECQHGFCDSTTGLSKCESNNWAGYLCDRCSDAFYGPECMPLIKILEIIPNRGPEKGGNEVHVWGHNFPETLGGIYKCRFGDTKIDGKWLAKNHVLCIAPRLPDGEVTLEISPNGSTFTNDRQTYFFYSSCPPEACGRGFNPSRGQCVFGSCSCFLPWKGKNCSIEILPPIIAPVSSKQTINETQTYYQQLKLGQGELPVRWYLLEGPFGMRVDERTGFVSWTNAFAKSDVYGIDVRASNVVGEDSAVWSLLVPLSYTASVRYIEPIGIYPAPRPVRVFGKIVFLREESARAVPVTVIATSKRTRHETYLHVVSDQSASDTFMTIYYPRPDDAGLFSVTAMHPGDTMKLKTSNVTWSVLGMQCKPSLASVDKIISADNGTVSISNISTLVNVGDTYIDNITGEVDGYPGAYIQLSGEFSRKPFAIQRLQANSSVVFDLIISNARPLFGIIYIIFTTNQGTSTGMRVNIKLAVRKPVLILEPPLLRESIVPGTMKVFDVNITNVGEVSANNVSISLPRDSRFSIVSFTSERNWLTESNDSIITILPKAVAHLSIAVIMEETESLGEIRGNIYINSAISSDRLPYTIFVTSSRLLNVTFTVKDEYTYFATGSPLVTNAKVRLTSQMREFDEAKYTGNKTGFVIFENIYEDQYTLYAEADDHSAYGAVILINPDTTEQDIFLPRIAVKYTWTVESTTVEDVYNIELQSTFETYVPMPVVTIQPAHINTIPLEQEHTSIIEFTLTNHGLIRADNVRFSLPTTHPYLKFESVIDFIGHIAANTSVVVPVRTILKHREKRSTGSVCVNIRLLYSFECSGRQTRSALALLTRGYAGGLCLGSSLLTSHGRLSGYRGGYSFTYVVTTVLACDCLKTFFKSCVLAFVPGVGCPLAVYNYITADHHIASLKDVVLGVLDIVVGCLGESNVKQLYTAIRCVQDVESKCSGGRSRREINSDILNAIVRTTGPMLNFINLAKEIIGNQSLALEKRWYNEFMKSVGDDTELGVMVSKTESSTILHTIAEQAYKTNLSIFLERYNDTVSAWENGTLSQLENSGKVISLKRLRPGVKQFITDIGTSKAKGFDSIFDEYEYVVKAYYDAEEKESSGNAEKREGVCARVSIRIEQELVLTRDAFKAKLEMENGETSDLEDIQVEIQIKQTFGSGDLFNGKFSIGEPTLIGISSVMEQVDWDVISLVLQNGSSFRTVTPPRLMLHSMILAVSCLTPLEEPHFLFLYCQIP